MSTEKNHYRKVFKSDYLGVADIEDFIEQGRPLIFTVKETKQFLMDPSIKNSGIVVAGKRISCNIAYFVEPIKPMVLNATNSKIMQSFHPEKSPMVEDWKNVTIELNVEKTKFKGEEVNGLRIRPVQPEQKQKSKPFFTEANFEKAKLAKASIDTIKQIYSITPEVEKAYFKYVTENQSKND